nr:TonB-dependent receptor [Xanthomonas campestris]
MTFAPVHPARRPRHAVLMLAVTAALTSATVQAQQAGAASAQTTELDRVQVLGSYASSLERALNDKRYAPSVIDSIEAEDIGKLPAQNVAEALQRLPGVTIERDRGEGVYVRVRGLGPNFQVTTLNGQTMAVNENVRNSGQTGRQFRFDTLPAELVSGLEVIKSPTAALDEGAIGGVVNVKTFRPLQLGNAETHLSAELSHPQLADENDPRVSGLYNWVNADKTLGVLFAAAYAERSLRQDRVNETYWEHYADGIDGNGDGVADTGAIYAPSAIRPTLELEQRKRIGVASSIQFAPSEALEFNLDLFYARQQVDYDEFAIGTGWEPRNMRNLSIVGNAVTAFDYQNGQVQLSRETSGMTDENRSVRFSGAWQGDAWKLQGTGFVSRAHSWNDAPIRRTRLRTGTTVDQRVVFPTASGNNLPQWSFTDGYDPTDPAQTPGRRLEWRIIDAVDHERALQFDADRMLEGGVFSALKLGAKYRTRERRYDRTDLVNNSIAGRRFDASYFYPSLPVSDMLDGGNGQLPRQWLAPREAPFWGDWPTATDLANSPTSEDLQNSYRVLEDISSAYAMLEFSTPLGGRDVRGNVGVRGVHTQQRTEGHANLDGAAQPVVFERSYNDVLPSLNVAYDLRPTMVLRGAAAKVITRPDLTDLSSKLTFNSSGEVLTASGGNPNLEPFEALQYDLTFEWYTSPSSALVAGVFYKDISRFVQTQFSNLDYQGRRYLLSSKVNGGKAKVQGVELAWQQVFTGLPAPFDGLGMQANYTWTDSEANYVDGDTTFQDALEGVAKNSYNLVGFYEKGPLSVRLSYSWRDDIVNSVGTADIATNNTRAYGTLDGNISWQITPALAVFANAINLTGEVQHMYVGDHLFSGYTDYGRTYSLGLRANF